MALHYAPASACSLAPDGRAGYDGAMQRRHAWDVTVQEAIAIQQELRREVVTTDDFGPIANVAGVDAGFEASGTVTRAAVAVLSFPTLALHDQSIARVPTSFPYVPGLLSFREVPAILEALATLGTRPDLLLCDGHGYTHPRRLGLACHLGLLADIPAIGVAKSHFIGRHDPLPDEQGAWQPLYDQNEVVGAVVRTRANTRPIYVSIGHRISLESAIEYVLRCTSGYRLPETTRFAHRLASTKEGI